MNFFTDDKNLIILTMLCIAMAVIFAPGIPPDSIAVLNSIVSGLLGMAIGKGLNK